MRHLRFFAIGLASTVLFSCGGDDLVLPSEGEPAAITVVQGNGASGRVGEALAEPLIVEVMDGADRSVAGATVVIELSGALAEPDTVLTDAEGRASAAITLGSTVGEADGAVRVIAPESPIDVEASFTVVAVASSANGLAGVSGDGQTGPAGSALPAPLVVEVSDVFGNPIEGDTITWTPEGGGSVSATSTITDGEGRTSVTRTLGPTAGAQTTLASSEGLAGSPVVFNHTVTAGNASGLLIVSGNNQTAAPGATLPLDLVVRLVDADGNPIVAAAVTWVVTAGGGTLAPATGTTDASGSAATKWTLGASAGINTALAIVSGVGQAGFTATAVAVPSVLGLATQPSGQAQVGVPFARQPVVQVRDAAGNPVQASGVTVTAAVATGAGQLVGTATQTTGSNGSATFTNLGIGGAAGAHSLIFAAGGLTSVTSSSIDVGPVETSTRITSHAPEPSAPGVGVEVVFEVTSPGGTPSGTVQVTASGGSESCSAAVATGRCTTVLTGAGTRTLTASFQGGTLFTSSSGTASHSVVVPNTPPTAVDDGYAATAGEQLSVPAPGVLANDTDPDDPMTVQLVPGSGPTGGTLTLRSDGSFDYLPRIDFFGQDSFDYQVTGGSATDVATVTIIVN